DIDIYSDASVKQLQNEMLDAAVRDDEANLNKGLVIEKLKLLPKVMATLQK
ncbi:Transcription factor iws1, partial [Tilletia horrida]